MFSIIARLKTQESLKESWIICHTAVRSSLLTMIKTIRFRKGVFVFPFKRGRQKGVHK